MEQPRARRARRSANDDPSPNAVIRLQRVRDKPSTYSVGHERDLRPHRQQRHRRDLVDRADRLYSHRALRPERRREAGRPGGRHCSAGRRRHALRRARREQPAAVDRHQPPDTMDVTGYVVYFSDRRGNKNLGADGVANPRAGADGFLYNADDFGDDQETGELGFEDIVNPASGRACRTASSTPARTSTATASWTPTAACRGSIRRPAPPTPWRTTRRGPRPTLRRGRRRLTAAALNWPPATGKGYQATTRRALDRQPLGRGHDGRRSPQPIVPDEARVNPPVFFRRALKIVNGGYTTPGTSSGCRTTDRRACRSLPRTPPTCRATSTRRTRRAPTTARRRAPTTSRPP